MAEAVAMARTAIVLNVVADIDSIHWVPLKRVKFPQTPQRLEKAAAHRSLRGRQRTPIAECSTCDQHRRAHLSPILDLLAEDGQLNVYTGELEVRPPGAPTTKAALLGLLTVTKPSATTRDVTGERVHPNHARVVARRRGVRLSEADVRTKINSRER